MSSCETSGGINFSFFVGIYGTLFVFIEMDSTLPAEIVANRFIERVASSRAPLADQVMYCVCKRIVEFDNYIFNSGTGNVKASILSITVNL